MRTGTRDVIFGKTPVEMSGFAQCRKGVGWPIRESTAPQGSFICTVRSSISHVVATSSCPGNLCFKTIKKSILKSDYDQSDQDDSSQNLLEIFSVTLAVHGMSCSAECRFWHELSKLPI